MIDHLNIAEELLWDYYLALGDENVIVSFDLAFDGIARARSLATQLVLKG